MNEQRQKGFTLVELLIATTVFSVIMLISTYGFLWINRYYTKGIAMARTQDVARNILADVSGQIQFTSGTVSDKTAGVFRYHCVGNKEYGYKINTVEDGSGSALFSQDISSGVCGLRDPSDDSYRVLLAKNTRVLVFDVSPTGDIRNITLALLNAPTDPGSPSPAGTDLVDTSAGATAYSSWRCKSGAGSEFCSLTKVSTTVYRRVQ